MTNQYIKKIFNVFFENNFQNIYLNKNEYG